MDYFKIFFVTCIIYAVIGNVVICCIIKSKGIQTSFIWTGTIGYLHKILIKYPEIFGKGIRLFSLSTIIVFIFVMLAVVIIGGAKLNA